MNEGNTETAQAASASNNKVVALTFTYPRDAGKAALFGAELPTEWERIWCVESKDAEMPVPAGVKKIVADFPRGGTLRDAGAVYGMRDVFVSVAKNTGCKALVKLDSDTALFRPRAFVAPVLESDCDFVYIRRSACEGRGLANGCCYVLGQGAISRLPRLYPTGIPAAFKGHEDIIFSNFFNNAETDLQTCSLDKLKVSWKMREYFGRDILAGHYGYYTFAEARAIYEKTRRELGRGGGMFDFEAYLRELSAWTASREGYKPFDGGNASESTEKPVDFDFTTEGGAQ